MKCSECNCITTSFDERLGETICNDCGLILSVDIFEETMSVITTTKQQGNIKFNRSADIYTLGSVIWKNDVKVGYNSNNYKLFREQLRSVSNPTEQKFKVSSGMFLSYYSGKSLLPEVFLKFKILKEEHIIRGLPIDNVAAGIVYYVLKEKNIPVSLKDFSKKSKIPTKNIMRTAKKLTKRFGKAHVFSDLNVNDIINQFIENLNSLEGKCKIPDSVRMDCYNFIEYIKRCYDNFNLTFTRNHIITAIWMVGQTHISLNITQDSLKELCNISPYTIRHKTEQICNNLNLDRSKLKLYTIENIINGVR
mgnify:CR=1 FL=1|jgi:transcription initiation factor TFIIIB Brf1 subunit/transcription initiation factor TFIIB